MNSGNVQGFKVFNEDWTCLDYDFKQGGITAVGTIHKTKESPVLCEKGFHFCLKVVDCFKYYSFDPKNKVAVVVGYNTTEPKEDCSKVSCQKLLIEREVSWAELLEIANHGNRNTGNRNTGNRNTGNWNTGNRNTGNWNTGNRNTGNRNTGDWNTGDWNTGDWNTGDWNTGNWNTGNRNTGNRNTGNRNTGNRNTGDWNTGDWNTTNNETGFFNTDEAESVRVFNKQCSLSLWKAAEKPGFLYFELTYWDDEEKKTKSKDYKEAFKDSWEAADKSNRMLVKKLPNFDTDVFFEISGIRVEDYE